MLSRSRFFEGNQVVAVIPPVDLSLGANTGTWVNVRHFNRVVVLFVKNAGTAGQDPTVTLLQAKDNAGTGSKAIKFTDVQKKVGAHASTAQFTKVVQAEANSYAAVGDAASAGMYGIEIIPAMFDDGFDHLQVQIPDVGAAAQVGTVLVLLLEPRFAAAQSLGALD